MQITDEQTEPQALANLGTRAIQLLCAEEYASLADLFGYIFAQGRDAASAVREELTASLLEIGASKLGLPPTSPPKVSYFQQNSSGLFALVEQRIPTDSEGTVLVELIVTAHGSNKWIMLEEISAVA